MATLNVSVSEARDQLPELIARVAAGDRVVITDGDKPSAVLGPAPTHPVSDPKAEAEAYARRVAFIRSIVENRERDGNPLPPDDPLWSIINGKAEK